MLRVLYIVNQTGLVSVWFTVLNRNENPILYKHVTPSTSWNIIGLCTLRELSKA